MSKRASNHTSLMRFIKAGAVSLLALTTLVVADLTPLADDDLSRIDGQAGLGLYLDELSIQMAEDPNGNNPGSPDGVIEITSDGGLSLAISDLNVSGVNGGSDGWTIGAYDDPFYLIAPRLTRLNADGISTATNTLVLATPSRGAIEPGRIAFSVNQYFDGYTELLAADASTVLGTTSMTTASGAYLGSAFGNNNPNRIVLNEFELNQFNNGFELDNVTPLNEDRRTHLIVWGDNNEIKLAGRVTFQTDLYWGVGYNDLGPGVANVSALNSLGRKAQLSRVGYATPVDDPSGTGFSPISSGLSIDNLSIDLALGRLSYQPLTFSIASEDGDLSLELAQIPGDVNAPITDPVNAVARDFYSDPLSKSNIKWDNMWIADSAGTPVEMGGGEIRGLRIHYLNITTCADATSVATCN